MDYSWLIPKVIFVLYFVLSSSIWRWIFVCLYSQRYIFKILRPSCQGANNLPSVPFHKVFLNRDAPLIVSHINISKKQFWFSFWSVLSIKEPSFSKCLDFLVNFKCLALGYHMMFDILTLINRNRNKWPSILAYRSTNYMGRDSGHNLELDTYWNSFHTINCGQWPQS